MSKVRISGIGCTLMDYVYNGISFESDAIKPFLSSKDGDGGISPGKLVFTEELEKFSGIDYPEILKKVAGDRPPDAMNVGGPSVVSIIHAAQLLEDEAEINFTGAIGKDETGKNLIDFLRKTPLDPAKLQHFDEPTPFTHVLSDPNYNKGHGERSFINNIGAAHRLKDPGEDFFNADICVFGGTALVPGIHDNLEELLLRAKSHGAYTMVNTVYDFRNEKRFPGKPWPLGSGHDALVNIDILIMDLEESLKISGKNTGDEALEYFISNEVKGIIITEGAEDIRVYCSDDVFSDKLNKKMPVSLKAISDLKCGGVKGDTTGCGDNFVGGVIYSLAMQLANDRKQKPDMIDMVKWGRGSGGFACFYLGGTYYEEEPGEKKLKVQRYLD